MRIKSKLFIFSKIFPIHINDITKLKIVKNMAISFFTAKKQVITIIYKMRIKFKSKKETNMKLMDF